MSQSATGNEADATERAILAGGCFWGIEDLLRRAKGVVSTRVGYIGGEMPDPTYARHYGHAEAVEVTFDPSVLSYRFVLELFFQVHDPTTYEQQGSDVGPSYRLAIFYTAEVQKEVALAAIAEIEASGRWLGPVVSEINPDERFWEAEPEHQKYLVRYPEGYSCHFARPRPGVWNDQVDKQVGDALLVREEWGRKRVAIGRTTAMMPEFMIADLWGLLSGSGLRFGAIIADAFFGRLTHRMIAAVMGFGAVC